MSNFIDNLIADKGGINDCFLNCCFSSTTQLKELMEQHIHFQKTTIKPKSDNLIAELDYGSFKCGVKLELGNCSIDGFKKIVSVKPCEKNNAKPTQMEFTIET